MVVFILESVPQSLRGEITKWMLEPQAGVFVGKISGAVRELLWEKVCKEAGEGSCTLIQSAANEQGYTIRTWGDTSRKVDVWEGLFLIRRPNPAENDSSGKPANWEDYLHLDIWAKTSRGVLLADNEGNYHPLICHMIDTASVVLSLWESVLPTSIKEQIRLQLNLPTLVETGRWTAFFAGLHDIGKATPMFAKQWDEAWGRLIHKGFTAPANPIKSRHYVLSTILLSDLLLSTTGLCQDIAKPVAAVLGAHHGVFPDFSDLNAGRYAVGSGLWPQAQRELIQVFAHVLGIEESSLPNGDLWAANGLLMIIAGLSCVGDWIASNHDCFPFAGENVHLSNYSQLSSKLARKALVKLGWLARPRKMDIIDFSELFDKIPHPNHLQKQVINIAEKLDGPGLVLLEYPMGGGKTEAALWLADYLACTLDQKGVYFALPTMATSNQMFGRINNYLSNRFPHTAINTMLLHGHASLNTEFELIKTNKSMPLNQFDVGDNKTAGLQAAEWFTFRKRGLLSPYGIGTIDQVLLAVLQTKHFFVRLFGLAGKVVILDEVHAYDSYMQELLKRLLSWLAVCNASVILLSATLPASTRQALLDAYAFGRGLASCKIPSVSYPRLSWVCSSNAGSLSINGATERKVTLYYINYGEDWMELLRERLNEGGCAAIIVNTVGQAQAQYQHLKDYFSEEELFLFHARFPFDNRAELENKVLIQFGKDGTERPFRSVIVATQVLEQSLDLDFDIMVTELAPIDLLLQRSGRVWRHLRPRPQGFTGPALWVLMPGLDQRGKPEFESGTARVYEPHTLLKTWLVLRDKSEFIIPDNIEDMIEAVYHDTEAPENLEPVLREMWKQTLEGLRRRAEKDRSQAIRRYIPPVDSEIISQTLNNLEEDEEEKHPAFQALTRLSGPTVTVICLLEEGGELWTIGKSKSKIDLMRQPNQEEIRDLLGCSIRLGFSYSLVKKIIELDTLPTWEAQVLLRRSRLLRFNSSGQCIEDGIPLLLDRKLGLVVNNDGKEDD